MRLGGRIAAAIEIIEDMDSRRRPVADALKDWGLSHRFAGSGDRAAIGNIVYDVLRRRRSLGWRMGNDTPRALAFAAVVDAGLSAEDLSAALAGDRFAPQMPASADFARLSQAQLSDAPDAVAADVPDWMAVPLARSLGNDWVAEAHAMGDRPPLDMRVNALRATREAVLEKLAGFGAAPTPHAPMGMRIPPIQGDGRHPNVQVEEAFQTGLFEIQDEGSQIAALLAGARPGLSVLDYCAGAGGKTLALAADMAGEGAVHAYDADRQRLAPIWERIRRAGAETITVHAPRDDLSSLALSMDLVLVDAPCTGSGTWRRRPDARWRLTEQQLHRRMAEQDKVLSSAARYVKPGGHLAYVTCSVLEEENGARVSRFLEAHPEFRTEDATLLWRQAIAEDGAPFIPAEVGGGRSLTMTPHSSGTDGFFFARLTRIGGA